MWSLSTSLVYLSSVVYLSIIVYLSSVVYLFSVVYLGETRPSEVIFEHVHVRLRVLPLSDFLGAQERAQERSQERSQEKAQERS